MAPPSASLATLWTLWQSAKCISAEDWMKASSRNQKHGPFKDLEPFTESLPSKRAVSEKFSGSLRSSVAPWWGSVSKLIHDNWKTTKISSYHSKPNLSHSQITKALELSLPMAGFDIFEFSSFKVPTTCKQLRFLPFELTLHGSKIASGCVTCRCDRAPQAIRRV